MSIEKMGNGYELRCDYCSNFVDDFEDFMDAVNYKKTNNWKSVNFKGEWFDRCPCCLEDEKSDSSWIQER